MSKLRLPPVCVSIALLTAHLVFAEQVSVAHTEGALHGFLVLRTLEGTDLADGDLVQTAKRDRVTTRLSFRFKDGSIHDEIAVFSQHRRLRLISDHLVQKGPSFPHPMEVSIDAATGRVIVAYRDEGGHEKVYRKRLQLPDDVANGLMFTLVKNLSPDDPQTTVSMVAAAPKPRLVKLVISPAGEDPFSIGGSRHKAIRYVVKIEIGGLAGLLAPIAGKKPPDTSVWILPGEAPAFVKSEGPLALGGPVWRIELASPVWPAASAAAQPR